MKVTFYTTRNSSNSIFGLGDKDLTFIPKQVATEGSPAVGDTPAVPPTEAREASWTGYDTLLYQNLIYYTDVHNFTFYTDINNEDSKIEVDSLSNTGTYKAVLTNMSCKDIKYCINSKEYFTVIDDSDDVADSHFPSKTGTTKTFNLLNITSELFPTKDISKKILEIAAQNSDGDKFYFVSEEIVNIAINTSVLDALDKAAGMVDPIRIIQITSNDTANYPYIVKIQFKNVIGNDLLTLKTKYTTMYQSARDENDMDKKIVELFNSNYSTIDSVSSWDNYPVVKTSDGKINILEVSHLTEMDVLSAESVWYTMGNEITKVRKTKLDVTGTFTIQPKTIELSYNIYADGVKVEPTENKTDASLNIGDTESFFTSVPIKLSFINGTKIKDYYLKDNNRTLLKVYGYNDNSERQEPNILVYNEVKDKNIKTVNIESDINFKDFVNTYGFEMNVYYISNKSKKVIFQATLYKVKDSNPVYYSVSSISEKTEATTVNLQELTISLDNVKDTINQAITSFISGSNKIFRSSGEEATKYPVTPEVDFDSSKMNSTVKNKTEIYYESDSQIFPDGCGYESTTKVEDILKDTSITTLYVKAKPIKPNKFDIIIKRRSNLYLNIGPDITIADYINYYKENNETYASFALSHFSKDESSQFTFENSQAYIMLAKGTSDSNYTSDIKFNPISYKDFNYNEKVIYMNCVLVKKPLQTKIKSNTNNSFLFKSINFPEKYRLYLEICNEHEIDTELYKRSLYKIASNIYPVLVSDVGTEYPSKFTSLAGTTTMLNSEGKSEIIPYENQKLYVANDQKESLCMQYGFNSSRLLGTKERKKLTIDDRKVKVDELVQISSSDTKRKNMLIFVQAPGGTGGYAAWNHGGAGGGSGSCGLYIVQNVSSSNEGFTVEMSGGSAGDRNNTGGNGEDLTVKIYLGDNSSNAATITAQGGRGGEGGAAWGSSDTGTASRPTVSSTSSIEITEIFSIEGMKGSGCGNINYGYGCIRYSRNNNNSGRKDFSLSTDWSGDVMSIYTFMIDIKSNFDTLGALAEKAFSITGNGAAFSYNGNCRKEARHSNHESYGGTGGASLISVGHSCTGNDMGQAGDGAGGAGGRSYWHWVGPFWVEASTRSELGGNGIVKIYY